MRRFSTSSMGLRILSLVVSVLLILQAAPLPVAARVAQLTQSEAAPRRDTPATPPVLEYQQHSAPTTSNALISAAASAPVARTSLAGPAAPTAASCPTPLLPVAPVAPANPATRLFLPLLERSQSTAAFHALSLAAADPPPASCVVYGVDDTGRDSQFFTIDPVTKRVSPLGPRHTGANIEGIELDPRTRTLYAVAGSSNTHGQDGALFRVDPASGALTVIGRTGFHDLSALALRPTDGTLWAWSDGTGLIKLNTATGKGKLILRATKKVEGLAWSDDGTRLYIAAGARLLAYNPAANRITQLAANLPAETEGLDMRPDGRLVGSADGMASLFVYDLTKLQIVSSETIAVPYLDVKSIAWPACATGDTSAPAAADDRYSVAENTTLTVPAPGVLGNDSDPSSADLTALLAHAPLSGTLTLNPDGSFRYTPNANFVGVDRFTYLSSNGAHVSTPATVTITVTPVNTAPAIVSAPITSANVDAPYHYAVDAFDPDAGDTLTYALDTAPGGMAIDPASGLITWTPGATEQCASLDVVVRVHDAAGLFDVQRFTIRVESAGGNLLAADDTYSVDEDGLLRVPTPGVLANDSSASGRALSASAILTPTNGTLALNADGSFSYTPNRGHFTGIDHFSYALSDGGVISTTATVTITVNPLPVPVPNVIGLAPAAATQTITEAQLITGTITTVNGAISLDMRSLPSAQGWRYGAEGNIRETDVFSASNGLLHQNTLGRGGFTGNYAWTNVVDPKLPFTVAIRARVLSSERGEDNPWSFDIVVETGTESFEVGISPTVIRSTRGTFFSTTIDNTQFHNYRMEGIPEVGMRFFVDDVLVGSDTPFPFISTNKLILGDDTFGSNARADVASYSFTQPRVIAQSPVGGTLVLKGSPVDLVVASGPARITAPNVVGLTQADAATTITGARLTVGAITTEPSQTVPAGQVIRQSPLAGTAVAAGASVAIVVSLGAAPNRAPVAANDRYHVAVGATLTVSATGVLANDVDPDNDPLAAVLVAGPTHGTLTLHPDGAFAYTPDGSFIGTDSFTYQASDGQLNSNVATVTLASAGALGCDPASSTVPWPGNGAGPGGWVPIGPMSASRAYFTATRLPDGRVLMVGGRGGGDASAEIYDPATQLWHAVAPLLNARNGHTATLLTNGKVLITGGRFANTLASTELYDPATDTWSAAAALHAPRMFHTATLLADGSVLVTGGFRDNVGTLQSAERYDPIGDTWSIVSDMSTPRYNHAATLLTNGKVLVTGGRNNDIFASAELYDPATSSWTIAAPMSTPRFFHTATRLLDGTVLVVGGDTSRRVERYDPVLNTWTLVDPLGTARSAHTATLLPNGQVVVAGGPGWTAEVFDPATNHWSYFPSLGTARENHTATLLDDGTILVAGGSDSSAEIYRPGIAGWLPAASMPVARQSFAATRLCNGNVLIVGGYNASGILASAVVYDPTTDTWSPAASMRVPRAGGHTATLLANGKVLVVGGGTSRSGPGIASAELYDPTTNTWSDAGNLHDPRWYHNAIRLQDGSVLIIGGLMGASTVVPDPNDPANHDLTSVERYDPATNRWSLIAPMRVPRERHQAVLLANGNVLVSGGFANFSVATESAELYNPTTDIWASTGNMTTARGEHQAVLLANGNVLVVGGYARAGVFDSAEVYDPAANAWSAAGSLHDPRYNFAATLLGDGTVLVAGGRNRRTLATAERYDPATNRWQWLRTSTMSGPRALEAAATTAIVLDTGMVLIAGGADDTSTLATAELYDPRGQPPLAADDAYVTNVGVALTVPAPGVLANDHASNGATLAAVVVASPAHGTLTLHPDGSFTYTPNSGFSVSDHFTYRAGDGRLDSNSATVTITAAGAPISCEVPTPPLPGPGVGPGDWTPTSPSSSAHTGATATLLPNGQVLLVGGHDGANVSAITERFDPAGNLWRTTASLSRPRFFHTATLLPNGKVLVVGGRDTPSNAVASAEIYDPVTNTWSLAATMSVPRTDHSAVLLDTGKVLVAGGSNSSGILASAEIYDPAANTWTPAPDLSTPRYNAQMTLLHTGKALISGGRNQAVFSSAELYDPSTNTWSPAAAMHNSRFLHTATLLRDGTVLVAGGFTTSAERYDPTTNTWTQLDSMRNMHSAHTATLLGDGSVLIAGGFNNDGGGTPLAERFDPATQRWSAFTSFRRARGMHTTTLLGNGQLLLVGGSSNFSFGAALASAELYTPGSAGWLATANMAAARVTPSATVLANGKILVAGGANLASAEIYDPATGTWSLAASMRVARSRHTATLLSNGKVLVVGGFSPESNGPALASAELYDPASNTWSDAGNLHDARYVHTATLLCSGKVVVVGGYNGDSRINSGDDLASVEVYDPATNSWSLATPMSVRREHHAATLLKDGRLLITGGFTNLRTPLASAELYDPNANTWSSAGAMSTPRGKHQAVVLPNGEVLIAGGYNGGTAYASAELYDPTTSSWAPAGALHDARYAFGMAVLGDGTVLAAGGGNTNTLPTAERYDAATDTWTRTASMTTARAFGVSDRAALVLNNGLVLVLGGADDASALATAELYDPRSVAVVPQPPLAIDDSYLSTTDTTLSVPAPGVLADDGDPNGDAITATRVSGPSHGTLTLRADGSFAYTPNVGFHGVDQFTYRASDGALTSNVATVTIELNTPPAISSTPVSSATAGQIYTYQVTATDPDTGDLPHFALVSGPFGMVINPLTGNLTWLPDTTQIGRYDIVVQVADQRDATDTQRYTVDVTRASLSAPVITSTPILTAREGAAYAYQVTATDAEHDPLTFSLVIFPEGMTIEPTTGLISWTPSGSQAGSYTVMVQVSDGHGGTFAQRYTLTVAEAINTAPIITSNPETASIEGLLYHYQVQALDADGDALTFRLLSAPAGMTIDPATGLISWTATDAQAGIYGIVVEVADTRDGTDSQSFGVLVGEALNTSPVITSTPTTTAVANTLYQYQVLATDADHDLLRYSLVLTPTGMTIRAATGLIEWTPTLAQIGDYPLTVRVDDGRGLSANQSFVLHVLAQAIPPDRTPPSIRLIIDPPAFDPGGSARITIVATDNVGVTARALSVGGTSLALDANSQATFSSTTPGVYPVVAVVRDAAGNTASATASVRLNTPGDTVLPEASLSAPDDATVIRSVTNVLGTASDANLVRYELSLSPVGEDSFTPFAVGTTAVVSDMLGHLDPTTLQNGMYTLRLTVSDISGNTATAERTITIEGAAKVGIFTLSFTDLEVPLAGLPIQVVRTYDSRLKRAGDFGVGWTLDLKTVRLQTNGPLGANWQGTQRGNGFSRVDCIQETRTHIVTVTLPDGTVQKFRPVPTPQCQPIVPILQTRLAFTALPGTTATLAPLDAVDLVPDDAPIGPYNLVTNIDNPTPYDPSQFVLTLHDGRRLQIDKTAGLQQVTDLSGNTLIITRDGIDHLSAGGATPDKHVAFTRDPLGRITGITDPRGGQIGYRYDANGDLVGVTDQLAQTTTFGYNANHDLLTIVDPRGVQPIRNEYDEFGRLIAHTDASGNRMVYTHAIGAGAESVQDRLGQETFYSYNERGDVTSQTDALGNTTSYTYDERGNKLSETDALGHVTRSTYDAQDNLLSQTDALGHSTSYRYNERGQVLTTTDPLGHTTTNSYDANGNLTETRDPLGNSTRYNYDARGLQTSMTDALGHVTSYTYDASGNLSGETDALGHTTPYTYDENGNRKSQTTSRATPLGPEPITTSYEYDALNRVTRTTYPDGSTTQVAYNSIGQQAATADQLGRVTRYAYDAQGRLVTTTHPDGATERTTYDAEGRRLASTDRAGRTTTYRYDALGRLISTTAPDGATSSTVYNAIGQTASALDALGHSTTYVYDAAGRQIQVTDALSHTTTFVYDAAGNQASMTDARGTTTSYTYDASNRRTVVSFADGTRQTTSYDALGRSVAQTDQAGKTTGYGYDALGRLTSVTDALGQVTSYSYDEQGNQVTQTDALGRTTTFAYDTMGRRIRRTLPLGMAETMAYDAAGQLTSKTDFNGHTTTYAYDTLGRLTQKTPDPSLHEPSVAFDYTLSGQRAHMLDASGVTTYTYDLRDRLTSKATLWGALSYRYDANGSLLGIHSSNANGAGMDYAYDSLSRLTSVTDGSGTTSYSYDENGNLAAYEYPNQTRASYSYDSLNRLTVMTIARPAVMLERYSYTLGASGNRTAVAELGGRSVRYTYDDLYRLTGETISGAASGQNGAVGYRYDAVGNRLSRTSTLPPVPASSASYDANDRLQSDSYDANGNTIASGGHTYAYDFENHLVSLDNGAATYVYDGDGNRVAKTAGGVTTHYLVDDRNPTGYAQVLDEVVSGGVARSYTYGLDLVSERQASGVSFYGYDGHGSVRFLTDAAGNVTDRYDYDAFGVLLGSSGATPNMYLYSGEQYDANLTSYYLRERLMNQNSGRFLVADPFDGFLSEPASLHKYIYANSDPVDNIDPSGLVTLVEISLAVTINLNIQSIYLKNMSIIFVKSIIAGKYFIRPASEMRQIALNLIAKGATDSWVYDFEAESRELLARGLKEIRDSIVNGYKNIMSDVIKIKLKIVSPGLLALIRKTYGAGLFKAAKELYKLKLQFDDYFATWEKALSNTNGIPDPSGFAYARLMEKSANFGINMLPDFDGFEKISRRVFYKQKGQVGGSSTVP